MTNTENDLRLVLQSVVPDNLDASGFRARLDLLLAQHVEPTDEATGPSADGIAPVLSELTARRRRGPFAAWAVTAAACAAAVVGIVIAVLPGGHSTPRPAGNSTSRPAGQSAVPADVRAAFLPGTIVLDTVAGSGTRTFDVPARSVPTNFEYAISATCSAGKLSISGGIGGFDVPECMKGEVSSYSRDGTPDGRPITVQAGPDTTWRVTIVLAPKLLANANAVGSAGEDMTGRDSASRQSGRGTSTARFGAQTATQPKALYRVRLVCNGSGVSMPKLKTPDADGLTTRTCFAGREYVWQDIDLTLPATVSVVAAAGTTWTIVVDTI